MTSLKTAAIAATFALLSSGAMAQSVGNAGHPGAANTTDPNSAPMAGSTGVIPGEVTMDRAARSRTTDPNSAPLAGRTGVNPGQVTLDPAARANTSDPNSANSAGTTGSGRPANPYR
jgi:hypothetical protein